MTKQEPPRQPSDKDEDLLLDSPVMKLAVLVWTVGIFAIAIVLAHAGLTLIGLLVLLAGALIGLFAFWQPIVELIAWLRRHN